MPLLSFDVYSNYEEVTRLRSEINMLENRLKSFGPGASISSIRAVEAQLQSARAKFKGLAIDAANAGASLEMNIRRGANGAIAAINDLQSKLSNPIQGLTQIAGVAGLGMFLNNITQIRGQFQLMETNINTLLGSAEKGKAMMAELTEYAKVSPLDFQGTVGAAQMMLGFGIDQSKILPFMKALGDVSMGNAQRFQSLTLAFSQMSAAGKLMGQDLMQMVNAGFQPLDQLAKDTGKSIGQLKEEMSQGKISAEMVQQAFINATSEGGKFFNMSQAATATINGQMSMLGDATDLMFNDLGKASEGAIIKVIQGATWIVEHWKEVGGTLATAIATFGIYKASAMASEFAIKVAAEERSKAVVQGFEEEIAKMEEYRRQQALMAFDDDVRGAIETGSISTEMAEKIQMLREEASARKEAAQAAVDAAKAEQEAIADSLAAATEKVDKAQEMVDIAEQIGTAEEQAAAAQELANAQTEQQALVTQMANSQTSVRVAEEQLATATTQADTISQIQNTNATNLNTTAQNTNTTATGRGRIATALATAGDKMATIAKYAYTTAIGACTKAWHALKVAFATNPFGLILTALTTIIGLFMTFKSEADECSEEVERFGEAASKTKRNVETLYGVLDSVSKDSKVYRDALDELTKVAKEYGIQIDSEKDTLDQLNEKRAMLIALIEKEGEARQVANRLAKYEEDKGKAADDFISEMKESIEDESEGDATEYAEQFARIMADTVERKKAELAPMVESLKKAQADYSAEVAKGEYQDYAKSANLRKEIADLQTKIAQTANEEAKAYAKKMGMQNDYILDIKDTSKLVSELTGKITNLDKFIDTTKANAKAVNDELERSKDVAPTIDYSTFDAGRLSEELTKITKEVNEINSNPIKPLADPIDIHGLIEAAQNAENKIADVDNSSATPTTDNTNLENTESKGQDVENKMTDVDNAVATPYIDTKYIDIAIDKLGDAKVLITEIGGQVLNTTADERAKLKGLIDKYGTNGKIKAGTMMHKDDAKVYNDIFAKARLRSNFTLGGTKYQLNREQSMVLQQLMDKYGTQLGEGAMSATDARLYRQFKNDLQLGAYTSNKGNKEAALKAIKDNIEKQVKNAKTTDDFAEISRSLQAQQRKVDQGGELYKYYQEQLDALDKRDKTKKNKSGKKGNKGAQDDPKQGAYELAQMELEEKKRLAEMLRAEEMRQRELDIELMEDTSAKEIATIRFNSDKKIAELTQSAEKEAQTLEKNALREWLKGAKGRKEYQYYAQFSKEQLEKMRAEWLAQAKENISYDTQEAIIANERSNSLLKVYQSDFNAMQDYLKRYGTFQEQRLAITEEYAEKIKNAQNEGERLSLEAQKKEELQAVETRALTQEIDWYSVFSNVGIVMEGQLRPVYDKLKEYVKTEKFRKSSAEDQKAIIQAMDNLREQLGDNQGWKDLSRALTDYQSALNELRIATENNTAVEAQLNTLTEARNKAKEGYEIASKAFAEAKSNPETSEEGLKAAQELMDGTEKKLQDAEQNLQNFGATVSASNQTFQEAQARVQSFGQALAQTATNVSKPLSGVTKFLNNSGFSQLGELWGAFDQLKGGINALKGLKDFEKTQDAIKNLTDAASEGAESFADALSESPEEIQKAVADLGLTFESFTDATADAASKLSEAVASSAADATQEAAQAATDAAGDAVGALAKGLGKAGLIASIIAAILKILDVLKDGVGPLISAILDSILNAISGIIGNILNFKEGLFRQIGESLYKGILGIFKSIFTLGGWFDWWGNGESDKHLEEDIEKLTLTNEALRRSIDELTDEMRDAKLTEITGLYETQKSRLEASMKNTQEMMSRSGAAYSNGFLGIGGKKSSNHKIDKGMSSGEWARIAAITGTSVSSAGDFWNLTSEQMAKVAKDTPDLYAKIKGLADDGHKDASQFMDEYIEYYKELEALENAYRESLTAVSFDSVKDEFKSVLMDMESSAEDFTSNFEKMMQEAVINGMMNAKYNDLIQEWYKEFAAAMDGDGLSLAEQNRLKSKWDNIVNGAIADRDAMKKAMGWDGSQTQQSSSRTLAGMSQDTGEAIEGRLTALQIAVESIRAHEEAHTLSLADLNDELLQIGIEYSKFNTHQDNIERQLAKIFIELQAISENTGAIVKPIISMQSDIAKIKQNTERL